MSITYNPKNKGNEKKFNPHKEYNKGISRYNPHDNLTEDQLNLLIHNCNVYGVDAVIKKKYVDKLKELELKEIARLNEIKQKTMENMKGILNARKNK